MAELLITNLKKDNKEGAIKKGKIIYDTSVCDLSSASELAGMGPHSAQRHAVQSRTSLNVVSVIDEEIQNLRTFYEQKDLTITHDPGPPQG